MNVNAMLNFFYARDRMKLLKHPSEELLSISAIL